MNKREKETVQFAAEYIKDCQDLLSLVSILNSPGVFSSLIRLKSNMRPHTRSKNTNVVAEVLRELYN